MDQVTGRKTIEGEVVQVIEEDEKETYAMALGDVSGADGWSVLNFQVPDEPDTRRWRFILDKLPSRWFEYRIVYQVLTKNPEDFEEGEEREIEVVPSYLSTGKTIKGTGAPGIAVVHAEDAKSDLAFESQKNGDTYE